MEETQTPEPETEPNFEDSPVVHRICEACNNMFTIHAADPNHRCLKCAK